MIRHTRLLLVAACMAAPWAAGAQTPWRRVYKDSDLTVIFDTANVVLQSPDTWSTVTGWDYARPRMAENKKPYTRLVERAYVRCSPVRLRRVRSTLYAVDNVLVQDEGEVDPRDQAQMVWDRPKLGTPGEKAFKTICGILARRRSGPAPAPAKPARGKAATGKPPVKQ